MGRLLKSYVAVLVVASVIQAMALSYMFGQNSMINLGLGFIHHPLWQPLGITTWVLLGSWFVAYAVWLAGRE